MNFDFEVDAARAGPRTATTSSSRTSGPTPAEVQSDDRLLDQPGHVRPTSTPTSSTATSAGSRCRRPTGDTFEWDARVDLRAQAPVLRRHDDGARRRSPTSPAPACSPSSATRSRPTTSRPAGSIKADSPAGQYLAEHGVERKDFNSYGSRRGNHEVMIRGTFANIRLKNQLLDGVEGGFTRDFTQADGAAVVHLRRRAELPGAGHPARHPRRQGVRLRLVARLGGQGHEPARRQGRHRRELRAHPPLQPHRHGRRPAAVPGRRERRLARPRRHRDVLDHRASRRSTRARRRRRSRSSPTKESGETVEFDAVVRIDTPGEADYYRNGGILQYVLRSLVNS